MRPARINNTVALLRELQMRPRLRKQPGRRYGPEHRGDGPRGTTAPMTEHDRVNHYGHRFVEDADGLRAWYFLPLTARQRRRVEHKRNHAEAVERRRRDAAIAGGRHVR